MLKPRRRSFQPLAPERLSALQGAPLASFKARAGAFLIDFFVVVLLCIPVGLLLEYRKLAQGQDVHLEINPFHDWWCVPVLVLYVGLSNYFGHGQTLGKRLFRIRVLSLTHGHLSFWHAIERALGYCASALEGGFGFLQYFIHPNRQTTHDRIAETIVVAEPKKERTTPPS
jgi:uncharacterized RDD family membrane protein YckC